ncbi:MAG: biopolymer transporter ExbD [Holosporales bacterium]|jgi:biopolymer transport protein TolR|nr:biopolymer transporter ExbD [Holosporales bacterium]
MNNNRRRREHPNTYVNIAPLVEVMLVLIIIFMITAPMLNVGVRVNLPKTKAATIDDSQIKPVIISIDKNSNVYVDDTGTTIEKLAYDLPALLQERKSDTVYVRGDNDLPYGEIMKIMGAISALGVCKVSLIAETQADNNVRDIPEPRSIKSAQPRGREVARNGQSNNRRRLPQVEQRGRKGAKRR